MFANPRATKQADQAPIHDEERKPLQEIILVGDWDFELCQPDDVYFLNVFGDQFDV